MGSIQVTDKEGKVVAIRGIAHGEAIKTVGALQALTGTEAAFVRDTAAKIEATALNIRSYGLSSRLAWRLLQQSLEKSIKHALGTTTISIAEGETILRGLFRHMIPALGVVRTFPLAMRHVPFHLGGLRIHHPYHE